MDCAFIGPWEIWLRGIRGRSYANDPLYAEIIALKMGIQALIIRGGSRIIIETDSSNTVNLIQGEVEGDHPWFNLISECKTLLAKISFVLVCYIPRVCNGCAHTLAQEGYNTHSRNEAFWVDVIPPSVRTVLLEDNVI